MNKGIYFIAGLIFGGSCGFLTGKLLYEKKYLEECNRQIEEIRAKYSKTEDKSEEAKSVSNDEQLYKDAMDRLANLKRASEIVRQNGYSPAEEEDETSPEVYAEINVEEFSMLNGLRKDCLTLYGDGIIANDEDEIVDVEDTVGPDAVFQVQARDGDEPVYIRNLKTSREYELSYDRRTYTEVTGIYIRE